MAAGAARRRAGGYDRRNRTGPALGNSRSCRVSGATARRAATDLGLRAGSSGAGTTRTAVGIDGCRRLPRPLATHPRPLSRPASPPRPPVRTPGRDRHPGRRRPRRRRPAVTPRTARPRRRGRPRLPDETSSRLPRETGGAWSRYAAATAPGHQRAGLLGEPTTVGCASPPVPRLFKPTAEAIADRASKPHRRRAPSLMVLGPADEKDVSHVPIPNRVTLCLNVLVSRLSHPASNLPDCGTSFMEEPTRLPRLPSGSTALHLMPRGRPWTT